MLVRSCALTLVALAFAGCGESPTTSADWEHPAESAESSGPLRLTLGETASITDGKDEFELTPTKVWRDGRYLNIDVTITGRGVHGVDATRLTYSKLFAAKEVYEVDDVGDHGNCEDMWTQVTPDRTITGCLSFPVPEGTEPEAFQSNSWSGDPVEWDLQDG